MWLAISITVLVYSLIITIVGIIKDQSSYSYGLETIDIVIAGPITESNDWENFKNNTWKECWERGRQRK